MCSIRSKSVDESESPNTGFGSPGSTVSRPEVTVYRDRSSSECTWSMCRDRAVMPASCSPTSRSARSPASGLASIANTGSGRRFARAVETAAVVDVLLMPPLRQKNAVTCLPRNCVAIWASRSRCFCSLSDNPGF